MEEFEREDTHVDIPIVCTIVVVENEDIFLDFLQQFTSKKYCSIFARNQTEAQELCKKNKPVLVIASLSESGEQKQFFETIRCAHQCGSR